MLNHEVYMSRALQLAKRGLYTVDPNPRVGCVIVKNDIVIGEGWHQQAGEGHAEVHAIHDAGTETEGADCYVTLEPCSHFGRTPPCAHLLIKSGIQHVIIAMTDPNPLVSGKGIKLLEEAGIKVTVGLLEQQAEDINKGFCKRMRTGKPYVRSKIAMSLDGRTAMKSGESKWITGTDARQDVQKLRAASSAIMTGMGTLLADDPSLTVRVADFDGYPDDVPVRQPLRIVVSRESDIPEYAQLFDDPHDNLLVTTKEKEAGRFLDILTVPEHNGQVDLTVMMDKLAQRGLNEIMVEAGSKLNGALLEAGLIDELIIYMAPKIMGDSAKGLFHLPDLQIMADNIELEITDIRAIGKDWRITATPHYSTSI